MKTRTEPVLTPPDRMSYSPPGLQRADFEIEDRPFETTASRFARLQHAARQSPVYHDPGTRRWSIDATPGQIFKAKLAWEAAEIASGLLAIMLKVTLLAAIAAGAYALYKSNADAPKKPPQKQQQKR